MKSLSPLLRQAQAFRFCKDAFLTLLERKVLGYDHIRRGPNRNSSSIIGPIINNFNTKRSIQVRRSCFKITFNSTTKNQEHFFFQHMPI